MFTLAWGRTCLSKNGHNYSLQLGFICDHRIFFDLYKLVPFLFKNLDEINTSLIEGKCLEKLFLSEEFNVRQLLFDR